MSTEKIRIENIKLTNKLVNTFRVLLEQNPDKEKVIETWFEEEYFPKYYPNKECYCTSYSVLGDMVSFFYICDDEKEEGEH